MFTSRSVRLSRPATQPEGTTFESIIGGAIRRFRHHRSRSPDTLSQKTMTVLLALHLDSDRRAGLRQHAAGSSAPIGACEGSGGMIRKFAATGSPQQPYPIRGSAGSAIGRCAP